MRFKRLEHLLWVVVIISFQNNSMINSPVKQLIQM